MSVPFLGTTWTFFQTSTYLVSSRKRCGVRWSLTSVFLYHVLTDTLFRWENKIADQSLPFPLRAEQLVFRHHEVHLTYSAFCRLVRNDPELELELIDGTPIDREGWAICDQVSGNPPVRWDRDVFLAGHSFGGCTVVRSFMTLACASRSRFYSCRCCQHHHCRNILRYQ